MSLTSSITTEMRRKAILGIGMCLFGLLIAIGIFAANGWFPTTDPLSGKRTGWFGSEVAKNAPSSWNPFAMPTATPTPQLSKEYIYAGSRLLAVEDANASAVPPADLAVWRPSNGTWYVLGGPGSQQTTYQYGANGDKPVQGDFDGDGKTDFAVFRPSNTTWYIEYSGGSGVTMSYGNSTDLPAVADYDGDGRTDIALYRQSTGTWYIYQSSTQSTVQYTISSYTGGKISPADYDGDGKADPGVWIHGSPSQFHIKQSSNGQVSNISLGSASTDIPVSADYDGDGKADHALLGGNVWSIRSSITASTSTTTWQTAGATPVANDYDGDGKVDIACWLIAGSKTLYGYWYIKQSHDGSTRTEQWGIPDDIPVPAFFRR